MVSTNVNPAIKKMQDNDMDDSSEFKDKDDPRLSEKELDNTHTRTTRRNDFSKITMLE